jgi:hypothetical protein
MPAAIKIKPLNINTHQWCVLRTTENSIIAILQEKLAEGRNVLAKAKN